MISIDEVIIHVGDKATRAEVEAMLQEAESLIGIHTMGRSTQEKFLTDNQIKAINEAILDQIDYWIFVDPNMDMVGMPVSMKVGGTSLEYKMSELAPRAKRHLYLAGLLSRRVRLG